MSQLVNTKQPSAWLTSRTWVYRERSDQSEVGRRKYFMFINIFVLSNDDCSITCLLVLSSPVISFQQIVADILANPLIKKVTGFQLEFLGKT